jgi:unsaturated rhamnogalacturonyl hydrolase
MPTRNTVARSERPPIPEERTMRRIPLVLALMLTAAQMAAAGQAPARHTSDDALVKKVREAGLSIQRKSWEQGTLALAFLEAGDDAAVVRIARASLIYQSKDGVAAALDGAPVDPLMAGEAVLKAAALTGDPALRAAADRMVAFALKGAPRAADGTVFHAGQTFWSDSYNTTPPLLAAAGEWDEALRQIDGHRKRLWNPKARLIAHIWDEGHGTFKDAKFWGGGQGWAAASLARLIRIWPKTRAAERARLISDLRELIDGCLAHQTPGGLFHDIVDDPATFEETNLAQMLAYSIYTSVHGGWLPRDYLAAADRMRAAARAKVDADGFVQGVCAAPLFSSPGISAEGQAFFLLMEAAAARNGR